MYKALLLDLDGTSIGQSETISPRVEKAIKRVSQEMVVSFASSRDYLMVAEFAKEMGLSSLQISEGGARIFHPFTGEVAWMCPIAEEDARQVVDALALHEIPFMAVDGDRCVTKSDEITDWCITRVTAWDMSDTYVERLVGQFGNSNGVNVAKIIRTDNGRPMLDFTHADVSKGAAVLRYAELLGIEPGQMIAAGDSYNDISLLQACGLRIAMGNGVDELKAMADYVAPSVYEDGLAVAIEDFVMPKLLDLK